MKHVIIGVVALGLGLWGLVVWFDTFGLVMRGVIPFFLIIFGLVAAFSGLRDASRAGRAQDDEVEDEEDDIEEDEDEDEDDEDDDDEDDAAEEHFAA